MAKRKRSKTNYVDNDKIAEIDKGDVFDWIMNAPAEEPAPAGLVPAEETWRQRAYKARWNADRLSEETKAKAARAKRAGDELTASISMGDCPPEELVKPALAAVERDGRFPGHRPKLAGAGARRRWRIRRAKLWQAKYDLGIVPKIVGRVWKNRRGESWDKLQAAFSNGAWRTRKELLACGVPGGTVDTYLTRLNKLCVLDRRVVGRHRCWASQPLFAYRVDLARLEEMGVWPLIKRVSNAVRTP